MTKRRKQAKSGGRGRSKKPAPVEGAPAGGDEYIDPADAEPVKKPKKVVPPNLPQEPNYATANLEEAGLDATDLAKQVATMCKEYERMGALLGGMAEYRSRHENAEEGQKPDYTIPTKLARNLGKEYTGVLRAFVDDLKERDELEERVRKLDRASGETEFVRNRIAELNQPPYTELEAARTDRDAYETLIASTHYPAGADDTRPTFATDWVNSQLAMRNQVETFRETLRAQAEKVKGYSKPQEKEGDGNGKGAGK